MRDHTPPRATTARKIPVEINRRLNVIYTPKGLAREYASLACNLFNGCPHGCTYCFAAGMPFNGFDGRDAFHESATAKPGVIEQFEKDLDRNFMHASRDVELLFCFTSDPFPKGREELHGITLECARLCIQRGQRFTVLTKNPRAAMQILDLNPPPGLFRLGTTVTSFCSKTLAKTEPYAPNITERRAAIFDCYKRGVPTWISAEPTTPRWALEIVKCFAGTCEEIKVGRMNHDKDAPDYDWRSTCEHWSHTGMVEKGTKITVKNGTWMHAKGDK